MSYILGGYYLIQGAKPQPWMNAKLLPPVIWSACSCVCKKVPDAWVFTWTVKPDPHEDQKKFQKDLGLTDTQFLELQNYFDKLLNENEFGYPNVFMSCALAQQAYSQTFYKLPDLKLISISLPWNEVQNFIDEFEPKNNVGENGVRKKLRQFQQVESFASPIGFEVIGYDYADFHSLICGSMEQEIVDNYGVRFNSYGLIDSFEKTLPIVRDIRSGALPAESGYWASWLISEYPLG